MNDHLVQLTCVYCGHAYPQGTPSHGAQILTDHIRVCEKHPMRFLEEENAHLRIEIKRFKSDGRKADPVKIVEALDMLNWNRELRQTKDKLRAALIGLVGVETKEELESMETYIRFASALDDSDRTATINAIHALLETL